MVSNPSESSESEQRVRRFRAAVRIQMWYRQCAARLKLKRRIAWVIHQKMENVKEVTYKQLLGFYKDLLAINVPDRRTTNRRAIMPSANFMDRLNDYGTGEDKNDLANKGFDDITIESAYNGPHLSFPLNATHVNLLIQSFNNSGELLHAKYLLQLLHETRQLLKTKPNINEVSTSISGQVTVVGDLHGHLLDLLTVFDKNGLPDVTNPYVFTGNSVDNGSKSVEVITLLFACLLVWPSAVFLNRGNHEDNFVRSRHGIISELRAKYNQYFSRLDALIDDLFSWLPLATIINNRIFVTHGGVSNKVDLEDVRHLTRNQFTSPSKLLMFPRPSIDPGELKQVVDLLWSDPMRENGCKTRDGGCGVLFGPDVSEEFLERHDLSMIVRSNKCVPEGFEFCHKKQVLTIFSASNFGEPNKGAYVKFNSEGAPYFVRFLAREPRQKRAASFEDSKLKALRAKITSFKPELVEAFHQLDSNKSGSLSIANWCSAMKSTLKLDLPWRLLRPHLAKLNAEGKVLYMTSFELVSILYQEKEVSSVTQLLYRNKDELEAVFRMIDTDGVGYITHEDFKDCCKAVGETMEREMFTEQQLKEMIVLIDCNNDGKINYNEFVEAFRILDMRGEN